MKFTVTHSLPNENTPDALIYLCQQDETLLPNTAQYLPQNKTLDTMLETTVKQQKWNAKARSSVVIQTHGIIPIHNILLVGAGQAEDWTVDSLQALGAVIAQKTEQLHAKRISIVLSSIGDVTEPVVASSIVIGILLSSYRYSKYKKKEENEYILEEVNFLTHTAISSHIEKAETEANAVLFARDLVNEPPSSMTPAHLADVAEQIAQKHQDITCKVLSTKEMESLGMGGMLGIGKGASAEPKFIHLTYKGKGSKTIVLVGKGITFDSGGLSLKTGKGMEIMKCDMAGAALVLAVFSVISKLVPDCTVHGLIASAENMPGPLAVKPGDILTAMNGKTMEILNTDAEGRVVLADALSYAVAKLKPDSILDFATLTGACIIALGDDIAGVFVNDNTLKEALFESAQKTGESIWELPLPKQYKDMMKSNVADIKNIGPGKAGGAIQGALFLQEFVSPYIPWAHVDIAGPSFAEKDSLLTPYGGTGFGVRMIIQYLLTHGS